jgi:2-polyprenyl-3-methyl-5-hydroxy-6-metoxy-1,4-benzoquinol methylase
MTTSFQALSGLAPTLRAYARRAVRRLARTLGEPGAAEQISEQAGVEELREAVRALQSSVQKQAREIDALYGAMYELVHDVDQAASFTSKQTVASFAHQWQNLPTGRFMLSDPWFREHVDEIISEQELLIDRAWFRGKRVLDAGCGGARWSYGLAKLGAHVTAVDINPVAVEAARSALASLNAPGEFLVSPLEELHTKLPHGSFDLVWSWGVLHHCGSFTGALKSISRLVKPGGLIHLYLYGRESIGLAADITLFKDRMRYNFLPSEAEKMQFLRDMAGPNGDIHHVHDIYAPLINRRFEFEEVRDLLASLGFTSIERTVDHTEVWVRAVMGPDAGVIEEHGLPKKSPPYWFQQ